MFELILAIVYLFASSHEPGHGNPFGSRSGLISQAPVNAEALKPQLEKLRQSPDNVDPNPVREPADPPPDCNPGNSIGSGANMDEELRQLLTQVAAGQDSVGLPVDLGHYLQSYFESASARGVNTNLGLPAYSYFQGLIVSKGNVQVVGQTRVVGGVMTAGSAHLQGGAMVTTTPESQRSRVSPARTYWQVESWNEE